MPNGQLDAEVDALVAVLRSKNQQACRQLKVIVNRGCETDLYTAQGFEMLSAGLSGAVNGFWQVADADQGAGIANFDPAFLPGTTDLAARTWLIGISLVGFLLTGIATAVPSRRVTAFAMLFLAALLFQNALQHVYWQFAFGTYAPGVVTSVVLLLPVTLYVIGRALRESLVPGWYPLLLAVLVAPGVYSVVAAGDQITAPIRAAHELSIRVSEFLFR